MGVNGFGGWHSSPLLLYCSSSLGLSLDLDNIIRYLRPRTLLLSYGNRGHDPVNASASPCMSWANRTNARLGSAHARNHRGCRKIEAVNAIVLPRGALKKVYEWRGRKHWNQIQWTSNNFNFVIRHTMTYSSSSNNSSIVIHRDAAPLCMHINAYQVKYIRS